MPDAAREIVKEGIAFVPLGRRAFTHLTIAENLEMGCLYLNDRAEKARRLDAVMALFPVLRGKRAGRREEHFAEVVLIRYSSHPPAKSPLQSLMRRSRGGCQDQLSVYQLATHVLRRVATVIACQPGVRGLFG